MEVEDVNQIPNTRYMEGEDVNQIPKTGAAIEETEYNSKKREAPGPEDETLVSNKKQNTKASEQDGVPKRAPSSKMLKRSTAYKDMFRSINLTDRVFERKIRNPPPGAASYMNRRLYENVFPSSTICGVTEFPTGKDEMFLKFTDDGEFIISFGDGFVKIYRTAPWLSYPSTLPDSANFPPSAFKFSSLATNPILVQIPPTITEGYEHLDNFFIYVPTYKYGIFASASEIQTATTNWRPCLPNKSFYTKDQRRELLELILVRLEDGAIIGTLDAKDDYIRVENNESVHLYDNLLAIISGYRKTIHIYGIEESGFTFKRLIRYAVLDHKFRADNVPVDGFFSNYSRPQVQILDLDRIFIKFNNWGYGEVSNLFAIYNMKTEKALSFYKDEGSYKLYDRLDECFIFKLNSEANLSPMRNSSSTNDTLKTVKSIVNVFEKLAPNEQSKAAFSLVVEQLLDEFPFECQVRTPSPYLDPSLFRCDDESIRFNDLPNELQVVRWDDIYNAKETKFMCRRHPMKQNFSITPKKQNFNVSPRGQSCDEIYYETNATLLVHPHLPLMVSIGKYKQPGVYINIHRR